MKILRTLLEVASLATLLSLLQCSDDVTSAFGGILSVRVVDPQIGPVADQLITILPDSQRAQTNMGGVAVFFLPAGDHFVDAQVCCLGPGFITYHVPVTIRGADTTSVTLRACLTCE